VSSLLLASTTLLGCERGRGAHGGDAGPAGSGIALIDELKETSGAAQRRAALRDAGAPRVCVARRTYRTFESKSVGDSGSAANDGARPSLA